MIYNYDFFVSYAHKDDDKKDDEKDGFVKDFVNQLEDHDDFIQIFGNKPRVFYDKETIDGGDRWESTIKTGVLTSRFLIVLIGPNYFRSENCAKEFELWVENEMHRCVLGDGIVPVRIVDVPGLFSGTIDVPRELQDRFPNWVSELRKRQIKEDLTERTPEKIKSALNSLCRFSRNKVWRQDLVSTFPHNYSYPGYNRNFVGRSEQLVSLRKNLEESRYAALHGLGGAGKTELALTYGHAFAWDYQLGRVFINCENQTSLVSAILGSKLDLMIDVKIQRDDKEPLATLFNALFQRQAPIVEKNKENKRPETLGTRLLLILDNVTDCKLLNQEALSLLPDYVHVIATTQENPTKFAYLCRMLVDSLSDSEALNLLQKLRPFADDSECQADDSERQAAEKIISIFGGHVFRVEKIGAYLRQNKWETYQGYLEKTQKRFKYLRKTIDSKDFNLRHKMKPDEECLRPTLKRLTRNAKKLINWAALFGPDSVPVPWLGELARIEGDDLRKGLQELEDYTLLIPMEADSKEQTPRLFDAKQARLHRIAREIVVSKICSIRRFFAREQINKKIDEFLSKKDLRERLWRWDSDDAWRYASTADFCYDRYLELENQGPSEYDPHLIRRLNDLCQFFWLDRSLEISRASIVLGQRWADDKPDNPQALKALGVPFVILGNLRKQEDEYEQASECYEKAVEIWKKAIERKPDDSDALHGLGYSYIFLGDLAERADNYEQAREYYEKAAEKLKKALEHTPDNSHALYCLSYSCNILGDLAERVNNYEQAREYYEKVVEIWEKERERKPNNYSILRELGDSYKSLGDLAKSANDYEQARECHEKAVEIWKKALERKPDDSEVLYSLSYSYESLGDLAKSTKDYEQAREYYEKRLELWKKERERKPDDSEVLYSLSYSYESLGDLAKSTKDYEQAREYYEKRLELWKKERERKPDSSYALRNLSNSYESLGNLEKQANEYEQAKEYYEKRLELWKKENERKQDDSDVLDSLSDSYKSLGYLAKSTNDYEQKREYYQKELEIRKQIVEQKPNDYFALRNLRNAYDKLTDLSNEQGDLEQGEKYEEKAAEIHARMAALAAENNL
mgnify:CR=1 FL=1